MLLMYSTYVFSDWHGNQEHSKKNIVFVHVFV